MRAVRGRQTDRLIAKIAAMDRGDAIRTLKALRCTFELDFTDDYLRSISLGRLRHILLAASLYAVPPARRASA